MAKKWGSRTSGTKVTLHRLMMKSQSSLNNETGQCGFLTRFLILAQDQLVDRYFRVVRTLGIGITTGY